MSKGILSDATMTNEYRRRLAAFMAGAGEIAPLAFMAFGDGGHHDDMSAKQASADATSLNHEILRKPLSHIVQEDEYSVSGKCIAEAREITSGVISEAGIFDRDGHLVAWKCFSPKFTEAGETYGVTLAMRY